MGNTPDVSGVITFLFVCLHGTDYKVRKKAVPYYKRKDLKFKDYGR